MPVMKSSLIRLSRQQLEERFQDITDQNAALRKEVNQLERKLKNDKMNGRPLDNGSDLDKKCRKLENENQILLQKLKVMKHQLLTYTKAQIGIKRPVSRASLHKERKNEIIEVPMETTETETIDHSLIKQQKESKRSTIETEPPILPKTLTHISSTADMIRLHLRNQEMETELDELRFNLESSNRKLTTLSHEYDRLAGELETARRNLQATERRLAAAKSAASSHDALQDAPESTVSRFFEIELSMLKEQNKLLKESQDRLIASALEQESSAKITMQELSRFKSHVDSLERSLSEESERRRKGDSQVSSLQRELARWRRKYEKLSARKPESVENDNKPKAYGQTYSEDKEFVSDTEIPYLQSTFKRSSGAGETVKSKSFDRLFSDVIGIVNSYIERENTATSDFDISTDGSGPARAGQRRTVEKWQKMYEEIYVELEKVRNLLVTQYNINESLKKEMAELQDAAECDRRKIVALKEDCQVKIRKRDTQIEIHENQLKSIAAGDENALRSALSFVGRRETNGESAINSLITWPGSGTDLTLRFTKLALTEAGLRQAKSLKPTMFVSSEFFDFELETTPLLQGPEATFNYSTVYNLVVSNLLIHYVETDGIFVELFEVQGATYKQLGSATISLRSLIFSPTNSGARHLSGQLKFQLLPVNPSDEGTQLAVLDYHVDAPFDLLKAFNAQKRKMTASLCLPIGDEVDDDVNELCIDIHRCVGLGALNRQNANIYAAYEIFDLPVHLTAAHPMSTDGDLKLNDSKSWKIPNLSEALHKYLNTQELLIYLFDDEKSDSDVHSKGKHLKNASALGYISLPLFPLAKNQRIRGSFPLLTICDEIMPDVSMELSIYWRFSYVSPGDEIEHFVGELEKVTSINEKPSLPAERIVQERRRKNVRKETIDDASYSKKSTFDDSPKQSQMNGESMKKLVQHENGQNDTLEKSKSGENQQSESDRSTPEAPITIPNKALDLFKEKNAENMELNQDINHKSVSNSTEPTIAEANGSEKSSTLTESINGSASESNQQWSPRPESSASSVASDATYSTPKRLPTEDDIVLDDEKKKITLLNISDRPPDEKANDFFELDSQNSSQLSIGSSSSSTSLIAPLSSSAASDTETAGGPPKPPVRRSLIESSLNATRNAVEPTASAERKYTKAVEFTEPLHSSIPPSESSSFAESLTEGVSPKKNGGESSKKRTNTANSVALRSAVAGHPTLRNRTLAVQEDLAGIETELRGTVVRICVGHLRLVDGSSLLESRYDHAQVFVEWNFLDFSHEICETRHRLRLPRTIGEVSDFGDNEQTYELNRKQIALLRQWTSSNNKFMFTLVLDSDDDSGGDASDDLCVGELPLADVVHKSNHFLTMRDVDNTVLATLEVVVQYSDKLRTYL